MHIMYQAAMQIMFDTDGDSIRTATLPAAHTLVMPGVAWGAFDELWTPAFWAGRAWLFAPDRSFEDFKLGTSLQEEVTACVLGGYGIPAEVGLAAYERLRAAGIPETPAGAPEIELLLSTPLAVRGHRVRYRFARNKARQLAACLAILRERDVTGLDDRALRAFLTELPGIGPKTASWITRNWRGSDLVAILDIHICRAGVLAGVFPPAVDPARHYFALEERFLAFAAAIEVRPSVLDNLMWQTMRRLNQLALNDERLGARSAHRPRRYRRQPMSADHGAR